MSLQTCFDWIHTLELQVDVRMTEHFLHVDETYNTMHNMGLLIALYIKFLFSSYLKDSHL
jgi:hypothetical protein